jgi:hypothetical protein
MPRSVMISSELEYLTLEDFEVLWDEKRCDDCSASKAVA